MEFSLLAFKYLLYASILAQSVYLAKQIADLWLTYLVKEIF